MGEMVFICVAGCIGYILISCIIWSSISASWYVKYRNIQNLHTPTTCHLLNYTSSSHQCQNYRGDYRTYDTCFDERFQVLYPIFNHSYVTSVFASFDKAEKHSQTQIGSNYTCFYRRTDVTFVTTELPDEKSQLTQFYIAFTLVGLTILVMLVAALYFLGKKLFWKCPDRSIYSLCKKDMSPPTSTTTTIKNIEQPIQMQTSSSITEF